MITLWHQLATISLLVVFLFKFMKLAKLAIVKVIDNVENEKAFSTLSFMKSKLCNQWAKHQKISPYMCLHKTFSLRKLFFF